MRVEIPASAGATIPKSPSAGPKRSPAGVRYRRPYQTRHTYASMMLSAGENLMYVANQMGHADWSMLVKVYGKWIPSESLQPSGQRVAAAHASDWPALMALLDTRPLPRAEDEAEDEEADDGDAEMDDEGEGAATDAG